MIKSMSVRGLRSMLLSTALLAAGMPSALADTYPSKPIHLVVPYSAGGTADVLARLLGSALEKPLGQPIVIENRAGAGGNIGTQSVARANADGYTLMLGNAPTLTINPHLHKRIGYDPFKDFAPINLVAEVPLFLVVNKAAPYQSVQEFAAWVKANPDKLIFASGGGGSLTQLSMDMFLAEIGAKGVHVPYKGSPAALTALMANDVPVMFDLLTSSLPFVTNGKLNALAVTSAARQSAHPTIPTVAESGFPNFEAASWFGIVAPAGTPQAAIDKLNSAIEKAVGSEEFKARLLGIGASPIQAGPAQFKRFIASEHAKWGKVVQASGAVAP